MFTLAVRVNKESALRPAISRTLELKRPMLGRRQIVPARTLEYAYLPLQVVLLGKVQVPKVPESAQVGPCWHLVHLYSLPGWLSAIRPSAMSSIGNVLHTLLACCGACDVMHCSTIMYCYGDCSRPRGPIVCARHHWQGGQHA